MNILQAMNDPELFGPHFSGDTWDPWRSFLAATFGLQVPDPGLLLECAGREKGPTSPVREAWLIVGRRGGKSRVTALIAVYLACFFDYGKYLAPGEVGLVSVTASDRKQARVIMRYVEAFLTQIPMLAQLVDRQTRESIDLSNRISIEVTSCSIKSARGYTIVAAINDEIAFWRSDESAHPDAEVLNAQRPAMASIPNAMLLNLSSPYAMAGALYDAYRRYFGEERDDILVWKAPTWVMNSSIPASYFDRERERDPIAFASEYGAEFRSDIHAAIDPAHVDAALSAKELNRPVSPHDRPYRAFVDLSGGRRDSAAMAVAHMEPGDQTVFVDALLRIPPPFSPESAVQRMAELAQQYRVGQVTGDNYAAELTVDLFRKAGLGYTRSPESASDIYLNVLPLFNTGRVEAPDNPALRRELLALERRTRVGGKDLITHPAGSHDDLANAACGAIFAAWRARHQGFEIQIVPSLVHTTFDGSLLDQTGVPVEPWEVR